MLAVAWAGLWKKKFGPIMSNFWGPFFKVLGKKSIWLFFENIVGLVKESSKNELSWPLISSFIKEDALESTLKSCIE